MSLVLQGKEDLSAWLKEGRTSEAQGLEQEEEVCKGPQGTKPIGGQSMGGIIGDWLWGKSGLWCVLSKECLESGVWGRLTWRQRAGLWGREKPNPGG